MERLEVYFSLLSVVPQGQSSAKDCLSNQYSPMDPRNTEPGTQRMSPRLPMQKLGTRHLKKKRQRHQTCVKSSPLEDTSTVEHSKEQYMDSICQLSRGRGRVQGHACSLALVKERMSQQWVIPAGFSKVEGKHKNGACQLLCPQRESHKPLALQQML